MSALISFEQLQKVAKIPTQKEIQDLIRGGKVDGRLNPLSVGIDFFLSLKNQTIEQQGLENILYFGEAAKLITAADVTRQKIAGHVVDKIVKNGLSLGERLAMKYDYWKWKDKTVKIKDDAIFYYKWQEENIGYPLLKRKAVEELINLFIRYLAIKILYIAEKKKDISRNLISEKKFTEKHGPKTHKEANIEGYPIAFIYGTMDRIVVYIEESKGKPSSPDSNDCDSERIRFVSSNHISDMPYMGVKYWYRIARHSHKDRNYGVFFLQVNDKEIFRQYFPVLPSLRIKRYLTEKDYRLVDEIVNKLLEIRSPHRVFGEEDPPEWFPKLIGLYKRYRKKVYK